MNRIDALAGLRVLDLGIVTAGAASSQVLADFGADVIKVESTTYQDPFRDWKQIAGQLSGGQEVSASPFDFVNRGKRGIAIDLKNPEGREVFLELVAQSDIVLENFRRGVLDRLGLSFSDMRRANPRVVLISLSSQGLDGPEASYISFGSTLEALGGVMALTGYGPDEPPVWTGNNVNYPDQLVSVLAPGVVLAALRARDGSDEAVHVDLAQREVVASAVGEAVLDATTTGHVPARLGNRHERFAPQGVYATAGEDEWIALSIRTDDQWARLVEFIGDTAFRAPKFATASGRRAHHDELDGLLEEFFATRQRHQLAESLQHSGIPASAVLRPAEVLEHPQLEALGFMQVEQRTGDVDRGFVARLSSTPGEVPRAAPRVGEHTVEVLRDVLQYDDARIGHLRESGAVGGEEPSPDEHVS